MANTKDRGLIREEVRCMLTTDELLALGDEMADLIEEKDQLEKDKSAANKLAREKIEAIDEQLTALAETRKREWEMREVEMRVVHDYDASLVRFVRADNGVEVREPRAMTIHEINFGITFNGGIVEPMCTGHLVWKPMPGDETMFEAESVLSLGEGQTATYRIAKGTHDEDGASIDEYHVRCHEDLCSAEDQASATFSDFESAARWCELTEEQVRNDATMARGAAPSDEVFPSTCRNCGCTDDRACETSDGPCSWAEPDLCSACAGSSAVDKGAPDLFVDDAAPEPPKAKRTRKPKTEAAV